MSKFEENIGRLLGEAFPRATIFSQHSIKYEGEQLFVDFFIPSMNIAIECQGEQHYKFVPHFHKDDEGYKSHIKRDVAKRGWARKNKVTLVEIPFNDSPANASKLFRMVYDQIKKGR
jgi:hypothetical protein